MRDDHIPYLKRSRIPLRPLTGVTLISGDEVHRISPSKLRASKVGQKAYGLASIPQVWSNPFFVVEGRSRPTKRALEECLEKCQLKSSSKLMVRSSGADESILARGSNESKSCSPDSIQQAIAELELDQSGRPKQKGETVHWVVQEKISVFAKGHLSNERRISKVDRDWLAEIEETSNQPYESHPIAIRPWRDPRIPTPQALCCPYKANYVDCLEKVARWAFSRRIRIHFEWVWDGKDIYIVQADESYEDATGSDPHDVVVVSHKIDFDFDLEAFHRATDADFRTLQKLGNTKIYKAVGYNITDFFVLSKKTDLSEIINSNEITPALAKDLEALTRAPLIIRTDGTNIPEDKRTMLPRSDELRCASAARQWLLERFAPEVRKLALSESSLSLVAHNYIPAVASAWCQAHPDKRRVRIESLWGIPEGIYWYAHDTYDIDTLSKSLSRVRPERKFDINRRLRYKSQFIAPDKNGDWVLHKTRAGPDWNQSIHKTEWAEEIAWSSRLIAREAGHPVVVMWFIGVPKDAHVHEILPWYHEMWHGAGNIVKAAPRSKTPYDVDFRISTWEDWARLRVLCDQGRSNVSRVSVFPMEAELVRQQSFVKELGAYAKQYGFVIELSGGILSHAYYLLRRQGCAVECSDLFAVDDEELEFNKLVRDRIPDVITTQGESVEVVRLVGEALVESLKRKVVEESFEILKAKNTGELQEEIADLFEVIEALRDRLGIAEQGIEFTRSAKREKRGGFDEGLMLKKTLLESAVSTLGDGRNFELELRLGGIDEEIARVKDLPSERIDVNKDTRRDELGQKARQITLNLPIFNGLVRKIELGEITDHGDVYIMESHIGVKGTFVKLKLRFLPIPKQVEMDL